MISGIYSAATAMDRATQRHELISQNLAHIDMPGYRRVSLPQQPFEATLDDVERSQAAGDSMGTASGGPVVDFSHGFPENTGNPLDLAIAGDGFFAIESPEETLYTRNGTFHLNAEGRLVTADGHPVAAESGELTLPPNTSASQLTIRADGTASVNGVEIGRIRLVRFDDPHVLTPVGVTLFRAPGGVAPQEMNAAVVQGMREHSNVHPVHELVDLIAATRAHEAAQKAMKTITDAIEHHTGLRGS